MKKRRKHIRKIGSKKPKKQNKNHKNEEQDAKQNKYILATYCPSVDDDFRKSCLLYSCITILSSKTIQQEYFWALIALLSTTTFGISFHDKYTTTFTLLKKKEKKTIISLEDPTFPRIPI